MDIKLIGNAYGAVEYAGAYVSKVEPDTIRFKKVIAAALKRCDQNLPYHALLKRVANATLSIREISAQEAYYVLLRELPLHGKSRTVTGVKVLRHSLRCYRVEKHELQNIIGLASIKEAESRVEPIEMAYMSRPKCVPFDTMRFATFMEEIDIVNKTGNLILNQNVWARTDGQGYLKRRVKAQVIRMSPWIAPDVSNPNFCYAELFLHLPWRSLAELPKTDEECIAAFIEAQET
ncbi:hypothetical protein PHMEG_00019282 [Phytophthora megakarya]|uniref:Uncharacterized protein n=1 Tax=Phytophthora megakarya TaxID=4795 RepID=A0A225VS96_9STRA|nr:hypothetical protein PHMEG_00019282 [Phytophthora megakarya]